MGVLLVLWPQHHYVKKMQTNRKATLHSAICIAKGKGICTRGSRLCGLSLQRNIISVTVAPRRLTVPLPAFLLKLTFETYQRSTDLRQKIMSNFVILSPQPCTVELPEHCWPGLEPAAAASCTMSQKQPHRESQVQKCGDKGTQIHIHQTSSM